MIRSALAVIALLLPAPLVAQARPHAELPSAREPARTVPITGYTLSLIWTPERCYKAHGTDAGDGECGAAHRGGFILHGLWPDGDGPNRWPQFCHPVAILTDPQIRAGIGDTPSPQLLQHEWAKHGSCIASDPVAYFHEEDGVYARIRTPDMAALSRRRGMTAADFQAAFAAANPGMRPDMMRLNLNRKGGWLEEVWLCLDKALKPRTCPANAGGAPLTAPVKVARPG